MRQFPRPRIVSSKCIEFEPCRYNGLIIRSKVVEGLKKYADFQPVCPEVEIGLGVPRDTVNIAEIDGKIELLQPATGRKLTEEMKEFSESFLNSIKDIDGFILKNKSPSCGLKSVRVYNELKNSRPRTDGVGLFAGSVLQKFPYLAIEDEGRIRNLILRENFFTKLFTLADFREVIESGDFNDLLAFQSKNKLLLLSYNQEYSQKMGKVLSNRHDKPLNELKKDYQDLLLKCLSSPQKVTSNINVLMHAMGYFSKKLTSPEKAFFLDTLEKYREGSIPLLVIINLIKSWIIRFNEDYLDKQTFFQPYPEDLMQVTFIYDKMGK
ncbi:YbgA family protein [Methanobacterium paludis]|uniref:DUF1722 domain-containing protein n=1 Tax=Methanobacterium paludis (strain DSM 25820 / JCM 18151 / SWAN1) TaxID=868131 RepID=F6D314_METPW|nr:DUF523 and DUF1722 domain-containing protein [Methanobacterium paludis]AEG17377.1 protein of unknown function DUF1722 [Methanobacterium paludis]